MPQTSLQQILRNLKQHVRRGDNVRDVASSTRMNAIMDALWALARGENLVAGNNLRKKQGEGYFILSSDAKSARPASASDDSEFPFQVVARINPDTGVLELGVISNSHLFNGEDRDTYEEDNSDWGLLDDDREFGWFVAGNIGDKIWLKITLDPENQAITALDVEAGFAWYGYPDPIHINTDDPDNPFHEFYYQIIAEITDPEQDPRPGLILTIPGSDPPQQIQVTQLLSTDLMMTTARTTDDADEPGVALLVPVPWNSPGTATDGSADEIPPEDDLMTPWQLGTVEEENHYSFELINASDEEGAKVLIMDGQVFDPNGDGILPEGMGDDNYILGVEPDDEIWVGMSWGGDPITINTVWIDHGPATPDDVPPNTTYVTIGYADIEDGPVPIVRPTNAQCGDIVIQLPPQPDTGNFVLMAKDGYLVWSEVCNATCGAT